MTFSEVHDRMTPNETCSGAKSFAASFSLNFIAKLVFLRGGDESEFPRERNQEENKQIETVLQFADFGAELFNFFLRCHCRAWFAFRD